MLPSQMPQARAETAGFPSGLSVGVRSDMLNETLVALVCFFFCFLSRGDMPENDELKEFAITGFIGVAFTEADLVNPPLSCIFILSPIIVH